MAVGQRSLATMYGLVAICLWSATMGFSRVVTSQLGAMTTVAVIYGTAGVLGSLWFYGSRAGRLRLAGLSTRYLVGCGGMFVVYTILLYVAIDLASGPQQVLEVGIINYLWPGLTVVFSVPLLGKRPRLFLPVGVVLAFAGILVAIAPEGGWDFDAFVQNVRSNGVPYALVLVAAVLWALYSNFIRRWAGGIGGAGIPAFMLISGLIGGVARTAIGEQSSWSPQVLAAAAAMIIGPALTGYMLWDTAMRRGNTTVVASAAYLIPILSSLVTCAVLNVLPGMNLWIGCGLVVMGAVVCKLSLR